MSLIISPYKNIEQYTRIVIEPHQMNSDIRNHLKFNLKKKVEKKCNKNGFVDEIYRITNYSDGTMIPENLSGNAIYDISYHCRLCIPIENSIIISQVKVINQELVVTINGPIMTFIPKDNVDSNIWNIVDNYTHKTKPSIKLAVGDYICVRIINKRINDGDTQIKTIGILLDLPSEKEIEKYFGSKIIIESEGEEINSNFI
uniref:RNA polymerase Rpb7-like N-terminal domain-containing protein n=1 Tax=viral metagenome TaxID=1070528 RepID=A0A6C0DAW1_9ZZZZ